MFIGLRFLFVTDVVYPITTEAVVEQKKLAASDAAAGHEFGLSVAIDGNTAVVGAHKHFQDSKAGSAYIFEQNHGGANNWGEVKKLTASDGTAFELFGYSVSISGDIVIVGGWEESAGATSNKGSAYIFERNHGGSNNWGEVKKLTASDGSPGDPVRI
jgi:hypothetical protein